MDPKEIEEERLYGELAYLWPLLSPPQDYAEEARSWKRVLREKLGPGRHEILALGVGGGHHLSHLTDEFQATAVDLSENMLQISRELNPGVEHHRGDMRSVRLGRTFQAVLVHDAIGYMRSEDDVRAALATAAAHLDAGGVFLTSPNYLRDTFRGPYVYSVTRSSGGVELTFIEVDQASGLDAATVESLMFFLIRRGDELTLEHDRHLSGLFPTSTWLRLLGEAGFRVEERARPASEEAPPGTLFVGTRTP
jgi:SAM-dependent methyltransferase